jgi:hypothetical protein
MQPLAQVHIGRPPSYVAEFKLCHRPATSSVHYTTNCNTQSSAPEDGSNNLPKHVELTGIINKPLLLHLVRCLYYLYQWRTVKQISDNEIYLFIKYIKSVPWRVAKRLSYIEDALCLNVKQLTQGLVDVTSFRLPKTLYSRFILFKRTNNFGSVLAYPFDRRVYETKFPI